MGRRKKVYTEKLPKDSPGTVADVTPDNEYIAGYGVSYGASIRNFPSQFNDRSLDTVAFEDLNAMMNDPEVASNVRTLTDMTLSDGVQVLPAFNGEAVDEESPDFPRAIEIAEFCLANLNGLRKPLKRTLGGLLEGAIKYGHKVGEITWKYSKVDDDGAKLLLDRIALKDYRTIDFVIDRFWNLLGFTSRVSSSQIGPEQIIPRDKFIVFTLHEEDEDPRGRSHIRPAYVAWRFKTMTWPEFYRWVCNAAIPSIVAKSPERKTGDVMPRSGGTAANGKQLTLNETIRDGLSELKNAGVVVLPGGTEVDQLEVAGDGEGFSNAIQTANSEVSKTILYQSLATNESKFGTRSQSEVHMGVLDMLVWEMKGQTIETLEADIIRKIVLYNFGPEALPYAPIVSLGDTERRDWATDASAAATIEGALTDSQWNAVTTQIGLPLPKKGEKPRREAMAPVGVQAIGGNDKKPAKKTARARGAFVTLQVRKSL